MDEADRLVRQIKTNQQPAGRERPCEYTLTYNVSILRLFNEPIGRPLQYSCVF